jgi:hypothetical protein
MLSPKKLRRYLAIVGVTMWAVWLVDMSGPGPIDRLGKVKGTDFLHFYVMGSIAREGRWEQLFDAQAHAVRAQAIVPGSADVVFVPIESPQIAIAFAPLASQRYTVALALWLAVILVTYGLSCVLIWRDCPPLREHRDLAAACLVFPGFYSEILHGQLACLAALAVATAAAALRRDRKFAAGLAFGFLVFKPHWVVAAGAVFVFAREWRVVAGIAVAAIAQVGLTFVVLGGSMFEAYVRALETIPRIANLLEPQPSNSLRGLFTLLIPFELTSLLVYAGAAVVTLLITSRIWRSAAAIELRLSAVVLAAILINPHVNAYDLILLAPVALLLTAWLLVSVPGASHPRVLATCLGVASAAPLCTGFPSIIRLQLSVTVMSIILWLLWRSAATQPRPAVSGSADVSANMAEPHATPALALQGHGNV